MIATPTTPTVFMADAIRPKLDSHGVQYGIETTHVVRNLPSLARSATAAKFIGKRVNLDYFQPGTNVVLRMVDVTVEGVGTEQGGAWRDMMAVTCPPDTNSLGRMVFVSLATVHRISTTTPDVTSGR